MGAEPLPDRPATATPSVPRPTVLVAGGGVVRAGAAAALRELVARTDLGVLNTFTAKGLFPWDHPVHLGTIGLQARDLELAGVTGADVVLIGVDDGELDTGELARRAASVRVLAPHDLADADPDRLGLPVLAAPPARPALYVRLSELCGPWYADDAAPLHPARAAADLAGWLPPGGVVAADAGTAGFWIGRTFPTRELGSVQLPVTPVPGFAAAQALLARRTGRASVAVVDAVDGATDAVVARAGDLVVEVWSETGPALRPDERLARLRDALAAGGVHVLELGVRLADALAAIEAVAGAPRWAGGARLGQ